MRLSVYLFAILSLCLAAYPHTALPAASGLDRALGVVTGPVGMDRVGTIQPGETVFLRVVTDRISDDAFDAISTVQFGVEIDPRLNVVASFASPEAFFVSNPTPNDWKIGMNDCVQPGESPFTFVTYVVELPVAEAGATDLRIDVRGLTDGEPILFGSCFASSLLRRLERAGGTVLNPSAPSVVHVSGAPAVLVEGRPFRLAWETFGATSATLDGAPVAVTDADVFTPALDTTYELVASDGVTQTSDTFAVEVIRKPRVDFFVAELFDTGGSTMQVRLSWDVRGADQVIVDGDNEFPYGSKLVPVAAPFFWNLEATNEWGTTTDIAGLIVEDGPPIIAQFLADPNPYPFGSDVSLEYAIFGADFASIDAGVGSVDPDGESVVVTPVDGQTYTLTATNTFGTSTADVTLQMLDPMIQSFAANPVEVFGGFPTTLTWSTVSAETVEIQPDVGLVGTSGQVEVTPAANNAEYTITATNPLGSVSSSVQIPWNPPDATIAASVNQPFGGETIELTVTLTGALSATVEPGIGPIDPAGGVFPVVVNETTTFVLTATNAAGSTVKQVFVEPKLPVATLEASETQPFANESIDLVATIEGAQSATLTPLFGPIDPTGGTFSLVVPGPINFILTATNGAGSVTSEVTITPKAPAVGLAASNVMPFPDDTITLVATVQGADSATLEPGFGSIDPSGGNFPTQVATTTTFTLSATNAAGTSTNQVTVTPKAPQVLIFAPNENFLVLGETVTLSWSVRHFDSITIDPGGFVTTDPDGSIDFQPNAPTTYSLTATNTAGSSVQEATVDVGLFGIREFIANPPSVLPGGSSTLSWEVVGAVTEVSIDGIGVVPQIGSVVVTPESTTEYQLRATDGVTTTTARTEVQVVGGDPARARLSWSDTDLNAPPPVLLPLEPFDFYLLSIGAQGFLNAFETSISIPPCLIVLQRELTTANPLDIGAGEDNWIVGLGECVTFDVAVLLHYRAMVVDVFDCIGEEIALGPAFPSSFNPPTPGYSNCLSTVIPFIVDPPLVLQTTVVPTASVQVQAQPSVAGVELQWTTNLETPPEAARIWRAAGGAAFDAVATLDGQQASSGRYLDETAQGGSYRYRVSLRTSGVWIDSPEVRVNAGSTPERSRLMANVPNPFNPSTEIRFELARPGAVTLQIVDVSGRVVRAFTRQGLGAGPGTIVWDGRDDRGRAVASGAYTVRLSTATGTDTRRITLLK